MENFDRQPDRQLPVTGKNGKSPVATGLSNSSEELNLPLPRNFNIFARSRTLDPESRVGSGGVAIIFHSSLPMICRDDLSGPDFLVCQLGLLLLATFYILPAGSDWLLRYDPSSWDRLCTLAALAASSSMQFIALGDTNARTGTLSSDPETYQRVSADRTVCARGRALLDLCKTAHWRIANGFLPDSSDLTSHQHNGASVVDYAILSESFFTDEPVLNILPRVGSSDHSPLRLLARIPAHVWARDPIPSCPRRRSAASPAALLWEVTENPPPLDTLFREAIACTPSDLELSSALYGTAAPSPCPLFVHTCGRARSLPAPSAIAAVFVGPN
ncbi:hypothetical protein SISNIDRAFT_491763 [Sistotremastrum niveocremeum HHB9708]|uniref:Endonuclease/exonuclease/phosphatase domain-containing protein n=1 Tax=Sistotremastrum niveocremeum HHB9708 TaxID=1314777 RepID=A0A164MFF4_9AGAM|nr:hypothetical protein SISNIDRAFT_491763 [Sistotremastrum niveocremeum HHB9708]